MRKLSLIVSAIAALTLSACDFSNPFASMPLDCVSWRSLNPPDTTRSSTSAVAHPDSVCTPKR